MPANNRIFYASQAVLLQPQNSDGSSRASSWLAPQGLQSVGMTTNFAIDPVFQLGQIDLYDQVENVPEVEVTLNKIIDGTPPLYFMCMGGPSGIQSNSFTGASGKELVDLVNNRVNFKLGVYPDNVAAATGTAPFYVDCSGMYLSRFNYSFPTDGNATEEITLVGNNKIWQSGIGTANGDNTFSMAEFNPSNEGKSPSAPGIVRRYGVNFDGSVLPTGTAGIPLPSGRSINRPYVQSVTISADLGREAINELGRMAPYFRYVNFPLEVTSEFSVTASDGDQVNARDFNDVSGCDKSYKNLVDKAIKLQVCGGTGSFTGTLTMDLGGKNKLTSVNYSGGDTGGGNATITYSFRTYNKFKMTGVGTYLEGKWVDNATPADTDNYQ
jgi:hypothetical protein